MAQSPVSLFLNAGNNWEATDGTNTWYNYSGGVEYTEGNVKLKSSGTNPGNAGLTGSNWVAPFNDGETHVFKITLNEVTGNDHFVLMGGLKKYGSFDQADYKVITTIQANDLEATLELTHNYDGVYVFNTVSSDETIKIKSITRTITTASSVGKPTITAPATYDGESTAVTITPGANNHHVKYSVSGSNNDVSNVSISAETTIYIAGSSDVTITAIGYKDENETEHSDTETVTVVYGIPSGKTTPSVSYYNIVPLTMSDGTSPAYYDFEDGTTLISSTSNIDASNLSIVDCDAAHTAATGSEKCMKIVLGDAMSNFYDKQIQLVFNSALQSGKTYRVHFWTKADSYTKNETRARFQKNGGNWDEYNRQDIEYGTSWKEYSYSFSPNGSECTMMVFDLGKVGNNTVYLDDVVIYDVTNSSTPIEFASMKGTAVIAASAFNDYVAGDVVCLNITGEPTKVAYKPYSDNDEIAISNYPSYTTLTQTNGSWLIPVTNDIISNGLTIKGYDMTLTSANIYNVVQVSELENNSITKYDNVVVELTRSLVADTWNTICLPFALTSTQATQLFGSGYKVAAFTGVHNEIMQFTTLNSNDDFEAGVPYLVNPTADLSNSSPVVLIDVDLTAKNGSTVTYDGYSFVGTLVQKTFTENLDYTRFVASGNELKKPISGSTLKALRAYFILPASFDPGHAPKLSIDGDGEATEIISLDNERVIMDNVYYDLSGRRVMNPTKGLYIVNGRKVIIK